MCQIYQALVYKQIYQALVYKQIYQALVCKQNASNSSSTGLQAKCVEFIKHWSTSKFTKHWYTSKIIKHWSTSKMRRIYQALA